jgi:hypothetical protein
LVLLSTDSSPSLNYSFVPCHTPIQQVGFSPERTSPEAMAASASKKESWTD